MMCVGFTQNKLMHIPAVTVFNVLSINVSINRCISHEGMGYIGLWQHVQYLFVSFILLYKVIILEIFFNNYYIDFYSIY